MPRLLLVTPAELTRDPRARRAAAAAQAHGLGVVGLCGQISGEAPVPVHGVDIVRVGRRGSTHSQWTTGTARRGEWPAFREFRGLLRLFRLAVLTRQLVRGGRTWGTLQIIHANDFATLPAAFLLSRAQHARLVYDAHELYSAFEPDPPRLHGWIANRLEAALARRAAAVVTVSAPIAVELRRRLGLTESPLVVLNTPALDEREPLTSSNSPLRAIYQGAFGPGRELDELLAAVRLAPNVELTLRVPRTAPAVLRQEVARRKLSDQVRVAEPVQPDRAIDGLHDFQVGVIFDRPLTRNAELSTPNKLFEYLMAGLAVIAPDLPALGPQLKADGVGIAYEPGRPDRLAAALEELASDRPRLDAMRSRARALAVERYNAKAQEPALLAAWGLR